MEDDKRKLAELCGLKHEKIRGVIHIWIYNTDMADWVAWNPFINIEQAMMVADKFGWYKLERMRSVRNGEYIFELAHSNQRGTKLIFTGYGSTPAEAICRAALEASDG